MKYTPFPATTTHTMIECKVKFPEAILKKKTTVNWQWHKTTFHLTQNAHRNQFKSHFFFSLLKHSDHSNRSSSLFSDCLWALSLFAVALCSGMSSAHASCDQMTEYWRKNAINKKIINIKWMHLLLLVARFTLKRIASHRRYMRHLWKV